MARYTKSRRSPARRSAPARRRAPARRMQSRSSNGRVQTVRIVVDTGAGATTTNALAQSGLKRAAGPRKAAF